jgi:AcrR family transcriptional regulator
MSTPGRDEMRSEHSALYKRPSDPAHARERLLRVAYDLFCRHGIEEVGVERIIQEANVARMTLYRNFQSKENLVAAALERREELWTRRWLEREIDRRADTPEGRLLAVFDALGDWFARRDYEGCFFVNTLMEAHDPASPIGAAAVARLHTVRVLLEELCGQVGVDDPQWLAQQWQTVMIGAIVAASAGERDAGRAARAIGELMLADASQGGRSS